MLSRSDDESLVRCSVCAALHPGLAPWHQPLQTPMALAAQLSDRQIAGAVTAIVAPTGPPLLECIGEARTGPAAQGSGKTMAWTAMGRATSLPRAPTVEVDIYCHFDTAEGGRAA